MSDADIKQASYPENGRGTVTSGQYTGSQGTVIGYRKCGCKCGFEVFFRLDNGTDLWLCPTSIRML